MERGMTAEVLGRHLASLQLGLVRLPGTAPSAGRPLAVKLRRALACGVCATVKMLRQGFCLQILRDISTQE